MGKLESGSITDDPGIVLSDNVSSVLKQLRNDVHQLRRMNAFISDATNSVGWVQDDSKWSTGTKVSRNDLLSVLKACSLIDLFLPSDDHPDFVRLNRTESWNRFAKAGENNDGEERVRSMLTEYRTRFENTASISTAVARVEKCWSRLTDLNEIECVHKEILRERKIANQCRKSLRVSQRRLEQLLTEGEHVLDQLTVTGIVYQIRTDKLEDDEKSGEVSSEPRQDIGLIEASHILKLSTDSEYNFAHAKSLMEHGGVTLEAAYYKIQVEIKNNPVEAARLYYSSFDSFKKAFYDAKHNVPSLPRRSAPE